MSEDQHGTVFRGAIARLRDIYAQPHPDIQEIIDAQDEVISRYQPVFLPEKIADLTAEDFQGFLPMKNNNKHWTNLQRYGGRICQDMDGLRRDLLALHDDSQPIEIRWDSVRTKGFGKATRSAILLIMYPRQYGVWNSTSEVALKKLGIWPNFSRGMSTGQRYKRINELLLTLAKKLEGGPLDPRCTHVERKVSVIAGTRRKVA